MNNTQEKQESQLHLTKSEQKVLKRANHNSDIPLVKSHKLNPRLLKSPVYYTVKRGNGIGIYKDHKEFIKAIKGINNPLYYVFTDLNSATYWLNESPVYPDYDSGQEMTPTERKKILHTAGSRANYMPHMNVTHTIYYAVKCDDPEENVLTTDHDEMKTAYSELKSAKKNPVLHVFLYKQQAKYFLEGKELYKSAGWKDQKKVASFIRHLNNAQAHEDDPYLMLDGNDLSLAYMLHNALKKQGLLITKFSPNHKRGILRREKDPFWLMTIEYVIDGDQKVVTGKKPGLFNNANDFRKVMKSRLHDNHNARWDAYVLANDIDKVKWLIYHYGQPEWNTEMKKLRQGVNEYAKKVGIKINEYPTSADYLKQLEQFLNAHFNDLSDNTKLELGKLDRDIEKAKKIKKTAKKRVRRSKQGYMSVVELNGNVKNYNRENKSYEDDLLFDSRRDKNLDLGDIKPEKGDDHDVDK